MMERYARLDRLMRISFRHLQRHQTGSAFVRHYFIVVELNAARDMVRDMQLTARKSRGREYAAV